MKAISALNELVVQKARDSEEHLGETVVSAVRAVGEAVAASIASAFAPGPGAANPGGVGAGEGARTPGSTPLAPWYADLAHDDTSDPTDHDPYIGIDAFSRPANVSYD